MKHWVAPFTFVLGFVGCAQDPVTALSTDAGAPAADAAIIPPPEPEPDTEITARFRPITDVFERQRVAFGAPGAALLIIENGEVTFQRGFGSKHPDHDDPVTSSTLFRIGSVNKVLTASVLLGLIGEGRANLDDAITTHAPEFDLEYDPNAASTITLRHLLTHTSGLFDYTEVVVPPRVVTDDDLEAGLLGDFGKVAWLMAPAGRMYNYSNPNFALAGLAIEKISGLKYRHAMRERLFEPLGMNRTYFLASEVMQDGDFANGRTTEAGAEVVVAPDNYDTTFGRPAGFGFSSVQDLGRFIKFLESGDESVMPDNLHAAMQSPQVQTYDYFDINSYGYGLSIYEGFYVNEFRRLRMIEHGGAIGGFSSEIVWIPSLRFGFVTLASTDNAYFSETLATALLELTTLPAPTPAPMLEIDRTAWRNDYPGSFEDPFNVGRVEIAVHTSSMTISMPDLDIARVPYRRELLPAGSPDNFLLDVDGYTTVVAFIRDTTDRVEYLRAREFVAHRSAGE